VVVMDWRIGPSWFAVRCQVALLATPPSRRPGGGGQDWTGTLTGVIGLATATRIGFLVLVPRDERTWATGNEFPLPSSSSADGAPYEERRGVLQATLERPWSDGEGGVWILVLALRYGVNRQVFGRFSDRLTGLHSYCMCCSYIHTHTGTIWLVLGGGRLFSIISWYVPPRKQAKEVWRLLPPDGGL
jgi:hypothetical protein